MNNRLELWGKRIQQLQKYSNDKGFGAFEKELLADYKERYRRESYKELIKINKESRRTNI
jgi:hypothetical protein